MHRPSGRGQPDEAALVARLKRRDEAAFRTLVRRWHGMLVALAGTVLRDRGAAEETVQETWLTVIDAIGGFEGRAALSSWLAAIALNKARDRARRDRRTAFFEVTEWSGADAPAVDPDRFQPDGHWIEPPAAWDRLDPERIVAGRQLWDHVSAAIEALPPGQRAVVVLRDVEGLEGEEICRLLLISPENQRVLLHRGRARLRMAIDALLQGGPPRG